MGVAEAIIYTLAGVGIGFVVLGADWALLGFALSGDRAVVTLGLRIMSFGLALGMPALVWQAYKDLSE